VSGRVTVDGSEHSIWFALAFFRLRLGWPGVLTRLRSTSDLLYGFQTHGSVFDEATGAFRSETKNSLYLPYLVQVRRGDLTTRIRGNILERVAEHQFRVRVAFSFLRLDLLMTSSIEPMIHGSDGVIQMGGKGESKYYSLSSMEATGQVWLNREKLSARGRTWFDHQWGRWQENCVVWKWFGVQLSNGVQIMIYCFENECSPEHKTVITLQRADGRCVRSKQIDCRELDHFTSEASGISYPTTHELRFEINQRQYHLITTALHKQQEIRSVYVDYWEGPCRITGAVDGAEVKGSGFCELIGRYAGGTANRGA